MLDLSIKILLAYSLVILNGKALIDANHPNDLLFVTLNK
jgi:hypothetical protein